MFNVGARIKQIRTERKIKTIALAIDCGISRPFISGIENGLKKCSIENLEKICNALNISLSDFFSTEPSKISVQEYALLDASKKLSPKQLDKLITFVESIGEHQ